MSTSFQIYRAEERHGNVANHHSEERNNHSFQAYEHPNHYHYQVGKQGKLESVACHCNPPPCVWIEVVGETRQQHGCDDYVIDSQEYANNKLLHLLVAWIKELLFLLFSKSGVPAAAYFVKDTVYLVVLRLTLGIVIPVLLVR